jgi:hypothetical protein
MVKSPEVSDLLQKTAVFKGKGRRSRLLERTTKHRKYMGIEVVENPYVRVSSSAELLATPVRSHVLYTVAQGTFVLN